MPSFTSPHATIPQVVRIPADVERPDRVLGSLTARQVAVLAVTGIVLYVIWTATRTVVPLPVFLIFTVPIGTCSVILALGQRDGIPLDRLVLAAIRQRLSPRHQVAAPDGVRPPPAWLAHRARGNTLEGTGGECPAALRLSATGVRTGTGTDLGIVDLGGDGLAVLALASTVNFALRTPAEQEALVASFGRYLHSLSAPVQVLVRTERLDLSAQVSELRARVGGLAHPALEAAALEHADYLAHLGQQSDLLRRQVLLILREPWPAQDAAARRAAESRLGRRLADAVDLLAPAGIVVTPLDAGRATAVLAAACNPDTLLQHVPGLAGAEEIITTPAGGRPDLPDCGEEEFAVRGWAA